MQSVGHLVDYSETFLNLPRALQVFQFPIVLAKNLVFISLDPDPDPDPDCPGAKREAEA